MGVIYIVTPLDSPTLAWARECSVPVDGIIASGRAPTLDELRLAAAVRGHTCQITRLGEKFDIVVESEKTITFPCDGNYRNTIAPGQAVAPASSIANTGEASADGEIRRIGVRGDVDLLVAIVRRLTRTCGPQVIVADCEGYPWLITSPDSVPLGPEPWQGPLPEAQVLDERAPD